MQGSGDELFGAGFFFFFFTPTPRLALFLAISQSAVWAFGLKRTQDEEKKTAMGDLQVRQRRVASGKNCWRRNESMMKKGRLVIEVMKRKL